MPSPRIVPGPTELRRLVNSGKTHQQIADMVFSETGQRVSRAAISSAVSRAGLSEPMQRYKDHLPWRVKIEHAKHYAARMLRLLGRRDSGEGLHPADDARLDAWLAKLSEEDAVVAYIPETDEGFFYVSPPKGYRRRQVPIIPTTVTLADIKAGRYLPK